MPSGPVSTRSQCAMSPAMFRRVIAASEYRLQVEVAFALGVCRHTVMRWLCGKVVINPAHAALIKEKLPPRKRS